MPVHSLSPSTLVIASTSSTVVRSLQSYIEVLMDADSAPCRIVSIRYSSEGELFDKLDDIGPIRLLDTLLVIDLWKGDTRQHKLLNTLILSFPEVYVIAITNSCSLFSSHTVEEERFCQVMTLVNRYHIVSPQELVRLGELLRLHSQGFRTIFDPTGFRSALKYELYLRDAEPRGAAFLSFTLSRIVNPGSVADEEASFLYLNSYALYKAGFRIWLLPSEHEFERVLMPKIVDKNTRAVPRWPNVLLCDWDLQYADWNKPKNRLNILQRIVASGIRTQHDFVAVVVTSYVNQDQLKMFCDIGSGSAGRVAKPYGGIFDLLRCRIAQYSRCNRDTYRICSDSTEALHNHFVRLLESRLRLSQQKSKPDRHGAAPAVSVVANRLLCRSGGIKAAQRQDVHSLIQGALLACEAKEILGSLSLTTALEALALQNELEVSVETSFFNTTSSARIDDRFCHLETEAHRLCYPGPIDVLVSTNTEEQHKRDLFADLHDLRFKIRGGPSAEEKAESRHSRTEGNSAVESSSTSLGCASEFHRDAYITFLLQAANRMRIILNDKDQPFPAEEAAVQHSKYCLELERNAVQRRIAMFFRAIRDRTPQYRPIAQIRMGVVVGYILSFPNWYVNKVTRSGTSIRRLLWSSALIVTVFAVGYYAMGLGGLMHSGILSPSERWWQVLGHSVFSFVPFFPYNETLVEQIYDCGALLLWQTFELLFAYLHLGLLLAMLYRKLTRHAP